MQGFFVGFLVTHAPITPKFPSSSSREIAKNYVEKYMLVGPPLFALLQLTGGVRSG